MLVGLLSVLGTAGACVLWVVLTGKVKGWAWLRAAFMWPGVESVALLQRLGSGLLTPTQRRGVAVHARLAVARFRCWRLGMKNHPR